MFATHLKVLLHIPDTAAECSKFLRGLDCSDLVLKGSSLPFILSMICCFPLALEIHLPTCPSKTTLVPPKNLTMTSSSPQPPMNPHCLLVPPDCPPPPPPEQCS